MSYNYCTGSVYVGDAPDPIVCSIIDWLELQDDKIIGCGLRSLERNKCFFSLNRDDDLLSMREYMTTWVFDLADPECVNKVLTKILEVSGG